MRYFKHFFGALLFSFHGFYSHGQEQSYAAQLIDSLSAPSFHGRGYVSDGDRKAAVFIQQEFIKAGLRPIDSSYFQIFSFPVNTFPGEMAMLVNGNRLTPGADFVVAPSAPSLKGKFEIVWLNQAILQNKKRFDALRKADLKNKFMVLDADGIESPEEIKILKEFEKNPLNAKGIIKITDKKFTWSVSRKQEKFMFMEVQKSVFPAKTKEVTINVEAKFIPNYISQNVIGFLPGTSQPDSFIVFTAHYDHLGRMGAHTYFPGANDNASGTAMIIDFANHYRRNPSPYSIVFIAFAAEEAGLIGSEFYTKNPLFPIDKIRFLINLDLMGNGQEGITVVNASIFPKEFDLLKEINQKNNHVSAINERGKAANSDHYHFSEKGVPAFFIYTLGGSKAYHDIFDKPEAITLHAYEEIFRLLTNFTARLTGGSEGK
jgi:aminopeptidase YwaD